MTEPLDPAPSSGKTEVLLVLTTEQARALQELIADRIWWTEAIKRAKAVSVLVGAFFVALAALASWWPWITSLVQALTKDVPKG